MKSVTFVYKKSCHFLLIQVSLINFSSTLCIWSFCRLINFGLNFRILYLRNIKVRNNAAGIRVSFVCISLDFVWGVEFSLLLLNLYFRVAFWIWIIYSILLQILVNLWIFTINNFLILFNIFSFFLFNLLLRSNILEIKRFNNLDFIHLWHFLFK